MYATWNTSLADEDRRTADDLHDWLWSNVRMQAVVGSTDQIPAWYGRLLSSITWLTTGDEVIAVFSSTTGESGPVSVDVVTGRRIIRAVTDSRLGQEELSVRAVPRSRIVEVGATEAGRLFSPSRATWPAVVEISVGIEGEQEHIVLPSPSGSTRTPDMGHLLRELLSDLDSAARV